MYGDICLIGIGTLGGFLAKNISELESTKNLTLIDYDIVEKELNRRRTLLDKTEQGG